MELINFLKEKDVMIRFAPMCMVVYGFVYKSMGCNYYIIINSKLSVEMKRKVISHEANHIVKHFPQYNYILSLNMHREKIEKECNYFFVK